MRSRHGLAFALASAIARSKTSFCVSDLRKPPSRLSSVSCRIQKSLRPRSPNWGGVSSVLSRLRRASTTRAFTRSPNAASSGEPSGSAAIARSRASTRSRTARSVASSACVALTLCAPRNTG